VYQELRVDGDILNKCKTNTFNNNFDAPDAHFDYSSLFSDAQVEKVVYPKKKKRCEN
jgi:hypothetical protein